MLCSESCQKTYCSSGERVMCLKMNLWVLRICEKHKPKEEYSIHQQWHTDHSSWHVPILGANLKLTMLSLRTDIMYWHWEVGQQCVRLHWRAPRYRQWVGLNGKQWMWAFWRTSCIANVCCPLELCFLCILSSVGCKKENLFENPNHACSLNGPL